MSRVSGAFSEDASSQVSNKSSRTPRRHSAETLQTFDEDIIGKRTCHEKPSIGYDTNGVPVSNAAGLDSTINRTKYACGG